MRVTSESDWDFYSSSLEGAPASISVDLALRKVAPDPGRPIVLRIEIDLIEKRENGIATRAESDRIVPIQDAMLVHLRKKHKAICAGMIYHAGKRRLYYYIPSEEGIHESVAEVMSQFPIYVYETATGEDPEWSEYKDLLFPGPLDMNSISTRRVVDRLKELGDSLTRPRKVQHWVYFEKESDRSKFVKVAVGRGYVVDNESRESNDPRPWRVIVSRIDSVSYREIEEVSSGLFLDAQDCNGQYDGWETQVIKGDP